MPSLVPQTGGQEVEAATADGVPSRGVSAGRRWWRSADDGGKVRLGLIIADGAEPCELPAPPLQLAFVVLLGQQVTGSR